MELVVFWVSLLIVVLSYMSLWYGISVVTKRLDVVDTAWGLGFVLVAWVSLGVRGSFGSLQIVSALLVSLWGLRLSAHIANRNWRKPADDARYQQLRKKWGGNQQLNAYLRIFLLQGLLFTLISTPMIAVAFSRRPASLLTYVAWAVWLGGIIFEAVADRQLAVFISKREKGSHRIMRKGLWHYSRHPNYFGEIMCWWGAAVVAVSVGYWWGLVGALVITLLITKVSGIPPLERRYADDTAYADYRRRTSVLIPLPPKQPADR